MIKTLNAKISYAGLEIEHGVLTCTIMLEFGCEGQGFGGTMLYNPGHPDSDTAGKFVYDVMETVGVDRWNDLAGKYVRIKADRSRVYEIGHTIEDKWFNPGE